MTQFHKKVNNLGSFFGDKFIVCFVILSNDFWSARFFFFLFVFLFFLRLFLVGIDNVLFSHFMPTIPDPWTRSYVWWHGVTVSKVPESIPQLITPCSIFLSSVWILSCCSCFTEYNEIKLMYSESECYAPHLSLPPHLSLLPPPLSPFLSFISNQTGSKTNIVGLMSLKRDVLFDM